MATSPEYVLDLISKLQKVHLPDDSGAISLSDELLSYMNEYRLPGQNTILMRAVKIGERKDVEFLLKIKRLERNRRNEKGDSAADISWSRKNYDVLLILLQNDSIFPKKFSVDNVEPEGAVKDEIKRLVQERETLHEWIRKGDLKAIEEYTKNHKSSVFYNTNNVSAWSRAIEYKRNEICSHLSSIRPDFRIPEMAIKKRDWPENWEKSHIYKFLHATKFLEEQDIEEGAAIIDMYLELDKHEMIRWLMKVIQEEDFEVYFEIKSEFANPEEYNEFEKRVSGFTNRDGRIHIGGRGITSKERYREVHGVFAHELCHLAMRLMYDNCWNPYHQGDKERKKEFTKIRDLYEGREDKDIVIYSVYKLYKKVNWEGELIVRVPHILGMYNEEKADQIFKEQILELHEYYFKYIIPDCKDFSNPDFHSIPLRHIKELSKYHGVVDKSTSPFNENFLENNKYEDYLIPLQNFTNCKVLYCTTSNPILCAMHIFHEQKQKFPIHAEKRCLAFNLECCFNGEYYEKILEALKFKICKTLILLVTKMESAWKDKIKDLTKNITEEKQVIIVTSTDICKELPELKRLNYQWNDLSKNYKMALLKKSIKYQGKSISLKDVIEYCKDTEVMNPDLLWHIMSQDELSIGEGISSIWNERELYVERTFVRFVYKEDNFQTEQMPSHYLFMTGVSELTGNLKKWSQTLSKHDDKIEKGKYIFETKNEKNNSEFFKKFCSKIENKSKQVFWIHHTNGKYLLREPLGRSEDNKKYFVEESFDEYQMLKETDGMSEVMVADDPGSGKSTSINSLIEKMKEPYQSITSSIEKMNEFYQAKLIFRVNFGEHLKEFSASRSLPSPLEFLQRVLKMNTPLEKMTLKEIIVVPQRVVVFFDGFDEMSKELQSKARKTLQLLREETQIQMWIFTRMHERLTLEEEMNIVSFSLRQFSLDDQRMYLNKFWVQRLLSLHDEKEYLGNKFQEILKNLENCSGKSERLLESMKELVNIRKEKQGEFLKKMNELDLSDYAELVINSVKDSILKGKFIVPLWLWMIANIILDSNFMIPNQTNRFTFYSIFLDKKVNSYLRDECNISIHCKKQLRIYNVYRKIVCKNLRMFSVRVMQSDLKKEDLEEMSNLKKYDLKEDDLQELVDVGLLRKVGEEYHFFHMTFAEFFFSQMIVEETESVNAKLLSDILIKDSYREVRIFLDDFLEKSESQSFVFPESLLKGFKLFDIYIKFCKRKYNRTGDWIWKRIFQSCEMHMKGSLDEDSILSVLKFSPFNRSEYFLSGVLDVLNSTFTDTMLFIMFDSRVDASCKFLFRCLQRIESNDLNAMMCIFQKIFNYKKSHLRSEVPSTDNSLGNSEVVLEIFEKEYKDEDGDSVLHLMTKNRKGRILEDLREIQSMIGDVELNKLLTMQNGIGITMLHILMEYSEDPKDVSAVLEFVEGVMEGELFKQFLTQKDNKGIFPIYIAKLHIMKDILVFMRRHLSNEYIRNMLRENKVHLGRSIRETDCGLEEILYLEEFFGSELFHEILISKDEIGGTRLYYVMFKVRADKLFVSDLKVYASFLDSDSMKAFLFSQSNSGDTFLHLSLSYRRSQYILRELHSILSPDEFEHFLNIINKKGETLIHKYNSPISKLYSFLDEFLGKEKLNKLVTAKNKDGETRLHFINNLYDKFDVLCEDLKFYSELLDESSFRDFIFTKDKKGKIFCSDYYLRGKETVNKLEGILSPDLFLELQKTVNSESESDSESEPESKRLRM